MMDLLVLFSEFAAAAVRDLVCLVLIFRLLSCKQPGKKCVAAVILGLAAVFIPIGVNGQAYNHQAAIAAYESLLVAACAIRFQGAEPRISLFLGIFYEIAVSFWRFLFASWLGVLFRFPAYTSPETGTGQIAVWLLHLLLAALGWYLLKLPHLALDTEARKKRTFRFACAIVLSGFFAVVTLSEQSVLAIDEDTMDMWTILSVVLMMSILVFNMNRQYEAEKELARLKSEQEKLLERDYLTLNQAYAINAKLFHDFHNHIGVLRQLLSHKKTEEAVRYLDELQAPVRELSDTVWTGDETVDYLINSKSAAARQDSVAYQVQVEFPHHTNLKSADLCAVLGNLLDNALEAARQVPEPEKRFVRLTIRRINQMLVIKVENSYASAPIEQDGTLQTSKDKNGLHGWGLKSAQAAAEKYDGIIQTTFTDSTFRAVATLSYEGIPQLYT